MRARRWTTGVVTLALLGMVAGLWWTREPAPAPSQEIKEASKGQRSGGAGSAPATRPRLVDMRPLLTARRLAALVTTPEEQELARQAERLADHSVDLAFAEAMRQVMDDQPAPTPEIRDLLARRAKAQAVVDADQQHIARLTSQSAAAPMQARERLQDALEMASAQLELDRDELNDAVDALQRAGGDPQARIQRLKQTYEAAQKEPRPPPPTVVDRPTAQGGSLLVRFRAWTEQRDRVEQLTQGMQEAREKAERLGRWRERLAQKVEAAAPQREAAKRSASALAQADVPPGGAPEDASATLASLKQLGADQRRLTVVEQRIQNQQDLGDVYGEWITLAETRARAILHGLLVGLLWILLALSAVYAISRAADELLRHLERDEVRSGTLRTVAKVAIQLVGALVILFMALGVPAQATTIIGLAGAGLTVAMKDFIVAFFGWFVLMGRNGLRVGDWVEIKGVGGEVAEIGVLHTVLLETGSWSDAGHPTGRRVSFVNSFAIEGHYFNFTTSGQWMWDELRVLIPRGQDPYPVIDGVQKLAGEATEANAKLAEQEWLNATTTYRVRSFSAAPAVNVIPTSAGVEVAVRYITRAFERHDTRRRLYQGVVELMHGKRAGGDVIGAA
jgi:small-conductance mechanosensitive channel